MGTTINNNIKGTEKLLALKNRKWEHHHKYAHVENEEHYARLTGMDQHAIDEAFDRLAAPTPDEKSTDGVLGATPLSKTAETTLDGDFRTEGAGSPPPTSDIDGGSGSDPEPTTRGGNDTDLPQPSQQTHESKSKGKHSKR